MKKTLLFISLLALVAGCDAPQRMRAPTQWVNGNSLDDPGTQPAWKPIPTDGKPSEETPTSPVSNNGQGPGFENCDLTNKHHTIDIGHFSICQSTQDEASFKFRSSLTSTTVRTCLIPTYKEASGSSTYIGQPQCTYTTANQTVGGKLYKDREGFSSYPLNGVIVMKEPLLPEYISCMHGYVNWPRNVCPNGPANSYCSYWIPRCPNGGRSNATCDGEARNYMGQICSSFKNKYSNSYLDIKTR
jgi:hypothetical protein